MKKVTCALLLAAGFGLSAIADDAANNPAAPARFDFQLPESIEMPGGEIYYHPKVVEVRPNGISIMHDNGVAFWPFNQLPEAVAKKFHYDPVAAQKYTDELLLRHRKLDEMKMKKQIEDADKQVYIDLVSMRYHCTELRMKIDATKRQIQWDKQKVGEIGKEVDNDRKAVERETETDTPNQNQTSNPMSTVLGVWNSSNPSDDTIRNHVVGEFDTDWKNGKTDYEMWTSAEHGQENNLAEYVQDYNDSLARVKQLETQWAEIQSRKKTDAVKLDKEIHDTVNKTINNSMAELQKLRQMRNDQLITTDEYIKKKAEILSRF